MRFYSKLSPYDIQENGDHPNWIILDHEYIENNQTLYLYYIDAWSEEWIELCWENDWIDEVIESQLLELLHEMGFESDLEIIWS